MAFAFSDRLMASGGVCGAWGVETIPPKILGTTKGMTIFLPDVGIDLA